MKLDLIQSYSAGNLFIYGFQLYLVPLMCRAESSHFSCFSAYFLFFPFSSPLSSLSLSVISSFFFLPLLSSTELVSSTRIVRTRAYYLLWKLQKKSRCRQARTMPLDRKNRIRPLGGHSVDANVCATKYFSIKCLLVALMFEARLHHSRTIGHN